MHEEKDSELNSQAKQSNFTFAAEDLKVYKKEETLQRYTQFEKERKEKKRWKNCTPITQKDEMFIHPLSKIDYSLKVKETPIEDSLSPIETKNYAQIKVREEELLLEKNIEVLYKDKNWEELFLDMLRAYKQKKYHLALYIVYQIENLVSTNSILMSKFSYKKARILEKLGRLEEAEKFYKESIIYQENYLSHFFLAQNFYKRKLYRNSLFHYERAAQIKPEAVQTQLKIATKLHLLGEKQASIEILERLFSSLSAKYPSYCTLSIYLVKAYISNQQYDEAQRALDETLEYYPNNKRLHLQKALLNYKLENYDLSIEILQENIERGIQSYTNYELLGKSYLQVQDIYKAIDALEGASKYYNTKDNLYFKIALLYLRLEKEEEAIQKLEKSLALNPKNKDATLLLISLWSKHKETRKHSSRVLLEESLELHSEDYAFHLQAARKFRKLHFFELAQSTCEKAIEIKIDFLPCYMELVEIFKVQAKYKEATEVHFQTLRMKSDHLDSYFLLGELFYTKLNKFPEAKKYLQIFLDQLIIEEEEEKTKEKATSLELESDIQEVDEMNILSQEIMKKYTDKYTNDPNTQVDFTTKRKEQKELALEYLAELENIKIKKTSKKQEKDQDNNQDNNQEEKAIN